MTEDNEFFRFPPLPKEEPPVPVSRGHSDEEESSGGKTGMGDIEFVPEWVDEAFRTNMLWQFEPARNIIVNKSFKKMIKLTSLDTSYKILTTLTHFEQHPDMDYQGLVFALQKASFHNYQMSLSQLVENFPEGEIIKWDMPVKIKSEIQNVQEAKKIEEKKQEDIRKEKNKEYNNKSDHMK